MDAVRQAAAEQRTKGILLVNRNKGQRGVFSARIAASDSPADGPGFYGLRAGTHCVPDPGNGAKAAAMADVLNLVLLITVSVGSLAFGILAAYGSLRVAFVLMRPQQQRVPVKGRQQAARVL